MNHFVFNKKFIILIIIILAVLAFLKSDQVKKITEILIPPNLPSLQTHDSNGWIPQYWTKQNWQGSHDKVSDDTQKYHYISQGTRTLPIPYNWFMHLEEPESSISSMVFKSLFFSKSERFSRDEYLLRFGFIRGSKDTVHNPDGLPIGLAKTKSVKLAGYPIKADALGFNCSVCHTGHFIHGEGEGKKEYIIEGGPSTTDLGQFTSALASALAQTALSSKLPVFNGRFDRFAKNVLGTQYDTTRKLQLANDLSSILGEAAKVSDIIDVQEGFGRLDALNRIGNQVFSKGVGLKENYQAIEAPVNFPHLWTTSWFDWVQYDASIMQPLVRNAGEAMGVNAHVSMNSPKNENRFDSSIPMDNLLWVEEFLKGDMLNTGLTAPSWTLTKINNDDVAQGKRLYETRCEICHLPTLDDPDLEKYFSPIKYSGIQEEPTVSPKIPTELQALAHVPVPPISLAPSTSATAISPENRVLKLKVIPVAEIGTDPAQGNVLVNRTINTAGNAKGTIVELKEGLGLDATICGRDANQMFSEKAYLTDEIKITDGGEVPFGYALGALVQQTIDAWFDANGVTDPVLKEKFRGGRSNCLQVGQGYKARPLNGVWSTAPFLHNGSVATLKDLLCPADGERPAYIQLGKLDFDAENVGLMQDKNFVSEAKKYRAKNEVYTKEGYFILDTHISGNSNSGHYFKDEYDPNLQKKGVIGKKFSDQECKQIIEYVKTL